MVSHTEANMVTGPTGQAMDQASCDEGFGAVGSTGMPMYYNNYGANEINEILNLTDSTQLGTSHDVSAHLAPVWAHFGIPAADIGSYS